VLVDWEHAEPSRPPFYDLVHYVLRARGGQRGRPVWSPLLEGLETGRSPIAAAIRAYATAAALPLADVPDLVLSCAERVTADIAKGER
jgi:hypothetical protein